MAEEVSRGWMDDNRDCHGWTRRRKGAEPQRGRLLKVALLRRRQLVLLLAGLPAAVVFGEQHFAEADLRRRDLDQLVVLDVFEGGFEVHLPRRLEQDVLVAARGPHVRQLLLFG